MKISQYVKESVKQTMGYIESENKKSFEVGAEVAFYKAEEFYKDTIKGMQNQIDNYKFSYENVKKDITTISDIIENYKSE